MARVEGISNVLRNLRRASRRTAKGLERGLKKAGLTLQRDSQLVVPIDTGALRSSAFTRAFFAGLKTEVIVGYTQSYAIFVHEILEYKHAPGKIAKYLERPARENRLKYGRIVGIEIERSV